MKKYAYFFTIVLLLSLSNCKTDKSNYYVKQVEFDKNEPLEQKIEKAACVIPTKEQYAWQQLEMTAFIHFGINTFTNREWGDGKESPELFNPTNLDTEQWVKTLKETGFKMVIITAKHHDGFCLWPTKTTKHSVQSSPWKNGEGDVVKELKSACKKYDLKFGVYLSPWDRNADVYGNSPEYNDFFVNQLTELLTWYGKVDEVWFDGANGEGPNGKKQEYDWDRYYKVIKKLQPDAVTAIMGNDVRWVGTESGYRRETEWSVTALAPGGSKKMKEINDSLKIDPTSKDLGSRKIIDKASHLFWYPAEVDVSIRPGWFYHKDEDNKVKSLPKLVDIYYSSVGRNAVLLLNIPPNTKGLIAETDVKRLYELKEYLDKTFENNLFGNQSYFLNEDNEVVIELDHEITFNVVELQEDIQKGQRVENFTVYADSNNKWKEIAKSTTIGYKKLLRIEPITTQKVKLVVNQSRATPNISNFSVYLAPELLSTPKIKRNKNGKVTITTESKISTIRYTFDHSEPTKNSLVYEHPFTFNRSGTVKAKAFINNFSESSSTITKNFYPLKRNWSVVSVSDEHKDYLAKYAIDDNEETMWHTPWSEDAPRHPHSIIVDMNEKKTFSGFYYIPRIDDSKSGTVTTYSFLISNDGINWTTIIDHGEFSNIANNPIEQQVKFDKTVSAQYFKFISHRGAYDENWLSVAEIGIMD